jgi:hypothetical protein
MIMYVCVYIYMLTYSERENKTVLVHLSGGLQEAGDMKKMLGNVKY